MDVSLPHLDRPFDYLVPDDLAEAAQPGARVKVRFAGKDLDGFVLERLESSDHEGKLARIRKVVSAEQVLTPEERSRLVERLQPLVESGGGVWRLATAYLSGRKPG